MQQVPAKDNGVQQAGTALGGPGSTSTSSSNHSSSEGAEFGPEWLAQHLDGQWESESSTESESSEYQDALEHF